MITHALGNTPRALGSRINGRTIRSLFRRNSPGIWYDPQDLTTMFQDAAGTLPVYRPGSGAVDPPVGLMLDKSQGLELGPELINSFSLVDDPVAGYTGVEVSQGVFSLESTGGTSAIRPQILAPTPMLGKTLLFDLHITDVVGTVEYRIYNGYTYATNVFLTHTDVALRVPIIGEGVPFFAFDGRDVFSCTLTLSIREIKGYHAYQTTATARPTLSGRYNLLLGTATLATQSVTTVATNYTLRFEGTGTITLSGTATGTYTAGTHTITCTAGTLTCTVSGTVTRADLRRATGQVLPVYQAVVNADTYDTAGFPLYLKRDKVDDVLTCTAPAITGYQGMGSTGGAVLGPVVIPAGAYNMLSESATTGIPEITRYVAVDGALTASEQVVVERYLSAPSSGVFADTPVFSFGLTSVSSFNFTLRTKADTVPVLIDWGDGTQSTHAGTTDQAAAHTYAASGTYAVKVYGADESVLTKFSSGAAGMSGNLVMPSGMTHFHCYGSNTLSGTLSLPSGMTYFSCAGANTLSGQLSLPSGMTYFGCSGSNTLSGTLSLPSGMTYFSCAGANTLSGYTPSTKAANQSRFYLAGQNTMSATDVDNILIDYAAAGGTWAAPKEITIQGNAANRTSASDAAYASLATKLTTLSVD